MIQFDAVHKRFPNGTTAVHDLSLEMPEGGVTALVGSSGCGKTTTLRMVNRMVEPTSGTIHVGGSDVLEQDAAQLRRSIGYVIQQSGLFPHRTVLDNNVLTTADLTELNRQVDKDKKDPEDVANAYAEKKGLTA